MKLSKLVTSTFAALVLAAACGGQLPPESGPATPEAIAENGAQRLTVLVSNENRFSPSALVVKAGVPIELTLRSIGLAAHDLTITDGVSAPVKVEVDGGGSTSATFTLDRPGTYTFICSVPGHADGGMHGTIRAE
ncbi:MAG: cupredoxin domain-containing protein [Candidatus Limnocylindria bacterium]